MFRTAYTRFLEAEVARLQERERKLLNAILPRLGYDPLDERVKEAPPKITKKHPSIIQWAVRKMKAQEPREVYIPRATREGTNGDATKSA